MRTALPEILLVLLGIALLIAAATDLRERRISNRLTATIALAAPLFWIAGGESLVPGMALHLLVGLAVFAVFAVAFAYRVMGGGDVKLMGALALWLPLPAILPLLLLIAVLGGVLTLAMIAIRALRRSEAGIEVPYGVAIAAAGLWVLGEPYVYLLSA